MKRLLSFAVMSAMALALFAVSVPLSGGEKKQEEKGTSQPVEQALKKIFPDLVGKPEAEAIFIDDAGLVAKCDYEKDKGCKAYPVKNKSGLKGYALAWVSEEGFKAPVKVLTGITLDGDIVGIEVLEQSETPERGSKITEAEFREQFPKKNLANTKWSIDKDKKSPGDIKAISGASFSSKAVTLAVKESLEFFAKYKDAISKAQK